MLALKAVFGIFSRLGSFNYYDKSLLIASFIEDNLFSVLILSITKN